MPIYEYKCDICNSKWEEIQNFSDEPLTACKSCEKEGGVQKLFSGQIAFQLKGEGWAADGYTSHNAKSASEHLSKHLPSSYHKRPPLPASNTKEQNQEIAEFRHERDKPANLALNREMAREFAKKGAESGAALPVGMKERNQDEPWRDVYN